jgi:ATP-binding cassette subfamily F protein 3
LKNINTENKKITPEIRSENGNARNEKGAGKKIKNKNQNVLNIRNRINELERNALEIEARVKDLEIVMSQDEFFKGGKNVSQITNDYNNLKEKLNNVYLQWENETEKLTKSEKQI